MGSRPGGQQGRQDKAESPWQDRKKMPSMFQNPGRACEDPLPGDNAQVLVPDLWMPVTSGAEPGAEPSH